MNDIKQQNFCQNIPGYISLHAAFKNDINAFQRNNEKYVSIGLKDGKSLGEIESNIKDVKEFALKLNEYYNKVVFDDDNMKLAKEENQSIQCKRY